MADEQGFFGLWREPGEFAPLETWERYLDEVKKTKFRFPEDKRSKIRLAQHHMAMVKRAKAAAGTTAPAA